jgi:molybdopterin synthase catalytic subunit
MYILNDARISVVLTREPLQSSILEAEVLVDTAGAVVSFIGTTRNHHEDRKVLSLEYEAQETMAKKLLYDLCKESLEKFDLYKASVHHRLGRVDIGQSSVVIAVSSAHRGAAFDGCRYIIDHLKKTVPIFKKEHYADEQFPQWIGPDGKPVGL